jgi:hypothetical protein
VACKHFQRGVPWDMTKYFGVPPQKKGWETLYSLNCNVMIKTTINLLISGTKSMCTSSANLTQTVVLRKKQIHKYMNFMPLKEIKLWKHGQVPSLVICHIPIPTSLRLPHRLPRHSPHPSPPRQGLTLLRPTFFIQLPTGSYSIQQWMCS